MKNKTKFRETEIGKIPEDWEVKELKDILEKNGYIRGPFGSALRRPELKKEGIPVYEQQNAIYNHRVFRFYIDGEKYKELKRFTVEENDLIISCSGTFGKVSLIQKEDPKGVISQALLILRPDTQKVNPHFLKYFFTSDKGYYAIASRSLGSVQVNIAKREVIEKIELSIPSDRNEQNAIVKILSDLDSKIELNRQMNKTLETIGQAIFKSWFVDFEFPNEQGKPYKSSGGEFIDSELGKIPKDWEIIKFGDAINIFDSKRIPISSRERVKRKGIFPYYGATGIIDYIDSYIFDGVYVLVGEDGSVIREDGRPFTQYVYGKFWVNNHAHIIQGKNNYSTEYIKLLLDFIKIYPYITGAVQPKLNQDNLLNIKLISPSEKILKLFNSVISTIFKNLIILTEQNRILTTIRDALLPKLITGKIRVNLEDIKES